jgi:hypothetical protein
MNAEASTSAPPVICCLPALPFPLLVLLLLLL